MKEGDEGRGKGEQRAGVQIFEVSVWRWQWAAQWAIAGKYLRRARS